MSIWVLAISFVVLYMSLRSIKNILKTKKQLQEEFEKAYKEALERTDEKTLFLSFVIIAFFYSLLWIIFYVNTFNIFNAQRSLLSLIAVFFVLYKIYSYFISIRKYYKKEINVNKLLAILQLLYIIYFLYIYITINL
jgi:cation transport ATPase